MRFAAQYAGVKYMDFCLSYKHKCETNILCAINFSYHWVNVKSDLYAEAEAYGTKLFYPEDDWLRVTEYFIKEIAYIDKNSVIKVGDHDRLKGRIEIWSILPVLIFTSNYIQSPAFKELFKRLVASPIIKKIDDETGNTEEKDRIYKQDWKPRERTLFTLVSV